MDTGRFSELPPEMQREIARNLDIPDLLHVRALGRVWKVVADDRFLWKNFVCLLGLSPKDCEYLKEKVLERIRAVRADVAQLEETPEELLLLQNSLQTVRDLQEFRMCRDEAVIFSRVCCMIEVLGPDISACKTLEDWRKLRKCFPEIIRAHPESVGALDVLVLNDLKLATLPIWLQEFRGLRTLTLEGNCFTQFPLELLKNKALQALDISRNLLSELPRRILELSNLRMLMLNDNKFIRLPRALGELRHLEDLHLSNNALRILPDEIAALPHLKTLFLDGNQLIYLPIAIGTHHGLQSISLSTQDVALLPTLLVRRLLERDILHLK